MCMLVKSSQLVDGRKNCIINPITADYVIVHWNMWHKSRWQIIHTNPSTLQRHNTENLKQIFTEKELRGLSPNFHCGNWNWGQAIPFLGIQNGIFVALYYEPYWYSSIPYAMSLSLRSKKHSQKKVYKCPIRIKVKLPRKAVIKISTSSYFIAI